MFKIKTKRQNPRDEKIPTQAMAALKIFKKHRPQRHRPHDLPTWGQIKTLTIQTENLASQQGMPWNPENIFIAMLALLAFASPAQAELINRTYWAFIPNPTLLQVVEWTDKGPIVSTNDSVHMPPLQRLEGPFHPEEEGRLINISLGYEVLPLCMGPAALCINVSRQTWAFFLPPKKNFRRLLRLFTALSFYENHVNTTETLGKGQKSLCKGFTYKNFKYTPIHWDRCQAKSGKLMFGANYTIVDWGPHGMWLSNFSDDINSTVCDYATQVA